MKHRTTRLGGPILLLAAGACAGVISATVAAAPAEAQRPGMYRTQGQYRSGGTVRSHGYYAGRHNQVLQPWSPAYPHRFPLRPSPTGPPFVPHSLSRSNFSQVTGVHPGQPIGGVVGFLPTVYVPQQAAPPPVAPPPPQVIVVQPQPVPAPPPPVAPPPPAFERPPVRDPEPVSNEPGLVTLAVHPADARVFLQDRFLGTGEEVEEELKVRPGVYVLEVEHPDFETQRLVFGVSPEADLFVQIDLTAERPGRRARVETGREVDFLIH